MNMKYGLIVWEGDGGHGNRISMWPMFIHTVDCAMSQVIGCFLGIGTGYFSSCSLVLPYQYHSNGAAC
jgi:hypothetical protein